MLKPLVGNSIADTLTPQTFFGIDVLFQETNDHQDDYKHKPSPPLWLRSCNCVRSTSDKFVEGIRK